MFAATTQVRALRCGHFMHTSCFSAHTRSDYTCPICSKSLGDMSTYFRMLDALLAGEQTPDEYAGVRQRVLCNDCEARTEAPFHFVHHACGKCRSYNTRLL